MSEFTKYEAYKKKLQGVCDENNLVYRFRCDTYPITLTIRPVGGLDNQMSLLENAEENGYISPDAYIIFAYKDGDLTYKTAETFTIGDVLFSKIKNLYKNMHSLWLQHFYREILERNRAMGDGMRISLPRDDDEGTDKELAAHGGHGFPVEDEYEADDPSPLDDDDDGESSSDDDTDATDDDDGGDSTDDEDGGYDYDDPEDK